MASKKRKSYPPPLHDDSRTVSLSGGGAGSSGSGSSSSAASPAAALVPVTLAVVAKDTWFIAFKEAIGDRSMPRTMARLGGELRVLDFVAHAAAAGESGVVNSSATLLGLFASIEGATDLAATLLDSFTNDTQCLAYIEGVFSASAKSMMIAIFAKGTSSIPTAVHTPSSAATNDYKMLISNISANSVGIILQRPFLLRSTNNEIFTLLRRNPLVTGGLTTKEVAAAVATDPTAFGKKVRTVLTGRFNTFKSTLRNMLFGQQDIIFPGQDGVRFFPVIDFTGDRESIMAMQSQAQFIALGNLLLGRVDPAISDEDDVATAMQVQIQILMKLVVLILTFTCKNMPPAGAQQVKKDIDKAYVDKLYSPSHESNCVYLETKKIDAGACVFVLHMLASVCGLYVHGEIAMNLSSSTSVRAINEFKLLALVSGLDLKEANYSAASPFARSLNLGDGPFCILRVPGIGLDQNDPRNQELLCEVEDLFIGIGEDDEIPHDPKVTAKGRHGNKPANFFSGPLFLGGWPTSTPIAAD